MSEAATQLAFFEWLKLTPYRPLVFHIPNGGWRDPRTARGLLYQGVTPGIPDIFCALPRGGYAGLFIEFKFGKNKLSEEQANKIDQFRAEGYRCEIFYDWIKAKDFFLDYVSGKINNV